MASDAVLELTDDTFESQVLESGEPVLVDFWAEWCGPCKALGPIVDEMAGEFAGRAKVAKLDIDSNNQTPAKFGIMSIPTVLFFKDGELKDKMVGIGGDPKATMREKLEALV